MNVVIVGGGVVGLSTALRIKERYNELVTVRVVAESFLDLTTSYNCGGYWEPYEVAGTPDHLIKRWSKDTLDYFLDLSYGPYASTAGVQVITSFTLFRAGESDAPPFWHDVALNFSTLSTSDLAAMHVPPHFVSGFKFDSVVVDQKYYLPFMMDHLSALGVVFEQTKVTSLAELAEYDCIINCAGLGSQELVSDSDMFPIRGQVLRVNAPWIKAVWNFGSHYIIPNCDNVVLGGTAQTGDYNVNPTQEDTDTVLDGVCSLFAGLRSAQLVKVWAGLRPGRRSGCRLDCETMVLLEGKVSTVISCYGHGGAGVTLGYGSAGDVVDLMERHFPTLRTPATSTNVESITLHENA